MKKILFLFMLATVGLYASNLSTLYKLYEKQAYDKACDYAVKYFNKKRNKNSEQYMTLYGLSCLETNNIHRIATPMLRLKSTKAARANATYFSTILLQKTLLFQALVDDVSLSDLHLPSTNFVVSKIFKLFLHKEYTQKGNVYIFKDEEKKEREYRLYIQEEKNKKYMIIDTYRDDKFSHRYRYQ